IEVTLPGDRRLTGTVDGVRGLHLVDVTYSRLGAKQVMAAWIRQLALTAAGTDDEGWQASTLGKGSRGKVARTSYGVLPRDAARSHLTTLLDVFALGQTAPLPLPVKTAHAWAQAVSRNPTRTRLAQQQAAKQWDATRLDNGDIIPGERDDSWWRLVHGREAPFDVLQQTLAGPGSDLATLAPRVWGPALDNVGSTA
ncbi:hypothetical protein AB4028_00465, partial [Janibacter sp. RAF20_2_2]